ncbi:hypothetical protein Tco_0296027 [Tanacetum coccineum]
MKSTKEQREGMEEKVESTEWEVKVKPKQFLAEKEKGFKQLESDEELARKIQEEWEAEEERNRIAEENAANEVLIRDFDDMKARIEADRLLAEKTSRTRKRAIYNRGKVQIPS